MSKVIFCYYNSLRILSKKKPEEDLFTTELCLPRLKGFEDEYFLLPVSGLVRWYGKQKKNYKIELIDLQFPLKDSKNGIDYEYIYNAYVRYSHRLKEIEYNRKRVDEALKEYKYCCDGLTLMYGHLFDTIDILKKEIKKMHLVLTLSSMTPKGNA